MDLDLQFRQRGDFPVDQPMEALRQDHELVRQLFERYFQSQDANEKRDLSRHALVLLEMHTSLEEGVFYPRVHDVDPSLIDHCEQEHAQAKHLIEQYRLMGDDDPQLDQCYRQLADAMFKHIETEEQQLFPKIEQANLDLNAIGREMQTSEISMIAQRTVRPETPGVRI